MMVAREVSFGRLPSPIMRIKEREKEREEEREKDVKMFRHLLQTAQIQ